MNVHRLILWVLLFAAPSWLAAQSLVTGTIKDRETGDPLPGVVVVMEDLVTGTSTDGNGFFTLMLDEQPPFILEISTLGYETRTIKVITPDQKIEIDLAIKAVMGTEVVITASKIEESILRAPVSIEKMDMEEIRNTGSMDAYSALANLKGVQMHGGSMSFSTLNTRGFSDMQNFRFIQLCDGIEMNTPGLNYAVGNLSAPNDIDIANFELVPGAGSALYGPNAFNGLLSIRTRNPFTYQGLSAEIKGGITQQQAGGTNPFGEVSLRYAKAFGNKFAFKITGSALHFHDWVADDESFRISSNIAASGQTDMFLNTPRDAPFYDAVNRYGDEVRTMVNLGDTSILINRSGIAERDMLNYKQQAYKVGAEAVYRPRKGMDLTYRFRLTQGDAVLRHTTIYPIVNFLHQVHSLELKDKNFFVRMGYSASNIGDSYLLLGTGAFVEGNLVPNNVWAGDYGAAFRGEVSGITANDHTAARAYADRNMPDASDPRFQELLNESLNNADIATGGSKFVDKSSFVNFDANYDFSHLWSVVQINVGASARRYRLDSEGKLFNDGPTGFNEPIEILEGGAYVQASKNLLNDRLSLRASVRFDKNQNYQARLTPRASAVLALDKKANHNLRFSYQTGFRNPANLESYINLDIRDAIVCGAVQNNIENYTYVLPTANNFTGAAAGTVVSGTQIFGNLKNIATLGRVLGTGDTSLFAPITLNPLVQEKLSTYEMGYKSLINNQLFIDVNGYYNVYDNFMSRIAAYSPDAMRVYSIYTNITDRVWAWGASVGMEYNLYKNFKLGVNYSYSDYNADTAIAKNPGFLTYFNTPKNRFNVSLSSPNVAKGIGFNLKFRWVESYLWESAFGVSQLPSYQVMDLALTYRFNKLPIQLKLGAANLLNQEYKQVYGGPMIGSQYFLSMLYDPTVFKSGNRQNPAFDF